MSVIVNPIVSAIKGVVNLLFEWIFKFFLSFVAKIFDVIFGIIGELFLPNFSSYSTYITTFWNYCFAFVGWLRSALCIDMLSMQLILLILTIKLTYKPVISVIKMFIHWWDKLKI